MPARKRSRHEMARLCGLWALAMLASMGTGCVKRNPEFVGQSDETSATDSSAGTGASTTSTTTASTTSSQECAPVLSSLQLTVFADNCTTAECHAGDAPAGALDLVDVDLFEDLLDVRSSTCADWTRVIAESPEQSILYAKVAGLATCEVQDPVQHEPLPEAQLQCLAEWIESIEACERCGTTECVDLATDAANCGQCGLACPEGVSCASGACSCPNGGLACDMQCVDPLTDNQNCGECGNDCQGSACEGGTCACVGLTKCDGCVDTATDPLHCGGCDQPCGPGQDCSNSACVCSEDPVSFSAEVQPVFTTHCVDSGCHGTNNPKKNMSLAEGSAYAAIVGVEAEECNDGRLRVEPGNPDNSYIMHKLLGMQMCGGVQMPSVGGPSEGISEAEIGLIAAWICQGALDN